MSVSMEGDKEGEHEGDGEPFLTKTSKIYDERRTTRIPKDVAEILNIEDGDILAYDIFSDGTVVFRNTGPQ